jgi:DNA-binding transcriptional regulator/RsmH inhibitor MraZ
MPEARRWAFTAARLGADTEVASQGRVTINSELRAELNLDGQELHVQAYNLNRIRILSAEMYAEQMADCKAADPKKDEAALLAAGLP